MRPRSTRALVDSRDIFLLLSNVPKLRFLRTPVHILNGVFLWTKMMNDCACEILSEQLFRSGQCLIRLRS